MSNRGLQKGTGFVNVREFVRARGGEAAWERVLGRLGEADASVVRDALPVGWYGNGAFTRLLRAVDEVFGSGDGALVVDIGRHNCERDATTIQRLFFRIATPAYVFEKSTEYWRRFHDSGHWTIERTTPNSITATLRDWKNEDPIYCRQNGAYIVRLMELVGAKNVAIDHPECSALRASACVFRLRWGSAPPEPARR
jgi:hypothetical protein